MSRTVLVCGGRSYRDRRRVYGALDTAHIHRNITMVITGGATGADAIAADWAADRDIGLLEFSADWSQGRKAGPLRNQKMLDEGKPSLVIAFPGGRGTADMIRRAEAAGISVARVTP